VVATTTIARIFFLDLPQRALVLMKSAILRSDIEMLFKLISMNLLVSNREMENAALFQDSGLAG